MTPSAPWLTADDVATLLGVSRKTVYWHVDAGHLMVKRLGRALRFDARALDQVTAGEPLVKREPAAAARMPTRARV